MMRFPPHGFGKVFNPCVDCKILMLGLAREMMAEYGAKFLISGEVLGQRPMSQRKDTLHVIRNEADVRDVLLRPLSAGMLAPTPMEESGLVDRSRLPGLSGRGRKGQFALARELGVTRIPPQAGGCRLGERESARRYWPVMQTFPRPLAPYFDLANVGRQLWRRADDRFTGHWLTMGRIQKDNEALQSLVRPELYQFIIENLPGPFALGCPVPGQDWDEDVLREAAVCLASFTPRARRSDAPVEVTITRGETRRVMTVRADEGHAFDEPRDWPQTRAEQKQWEKSLSTD